ncbi:MAG: hypothetical protein IKB65_09325 [Ruminiclostridium sp.]|nr:hypothetical protein [Ruminiclostridium sp.]
MTTTEKYLVRVTLFGPLTLENHLGRAEETPGRSPQPWLLLKYLLVHRDRWVPQEELDTALPIKGGANAARVRLSRLRDLLAPLGLEGKSGLVQAAGGAYRLNPRYTLDVGADRLTHLLTRGDRGEALALFRGPFLAKTPGDWAVPLRLDWQGRFLTLSRDILAGEETDLLPLLARQAQAMAPEYTNLHRDIRARLEGKSPPASAPADHAIVSKIIIQAGEVFSLSASSDQRPLVYERRAEPDWTRAFQETGLHGLLTAVARQIHRGTLRTRADSRLTRALRKALHAMGLENFQAMEEEEAVGQLVRLAEEALG